jgi:hypothetical protein
VVCRPQGCGKKRIAFDVVDSSGWLEFLTDGRLADQYAKHLRQPASVVTPTIVVYEVYKHAKRLMSEEDAVDAVAAMQKTRIVALTDELALALRT